MSFQQKELLIAPSPIGELDIHDRIGCELVAEALRAGAETRVRVMGTSMLPALWPRDVLVVRGGAETPAVNEIVLFLRYGRLFAHRVVRKTGSQLITRGDALPDLDPPVRASELLGVVVAVIRDGARQLPPRPPSIVHRMAALAIRRSDTIHRLVLRWRNAQLRIGGSDA
jgi:signal peptidase